MFLFSADDSQADYQRECGLHSATEAAIGQMCCPPAGTGEVQPTARGIVGKTWWFVMVVDFTVTISNISVLF